MKKITFIILAFFISVNLLFAQNITITKFDKRISKPILLQTQNQKVVKGLSNENFKVEQNTQNQKTTSLVENTISNITMLNQSYGFAIGSEIINGGYYAGGSEKSQIWVTQNGAKSWQKFSVDKESELRFIKMIAIDENNLFLHADPFSYVSKDGGVNWVKTINTPSTYLSKLTVYKNGIIVAAGSTKCTYSTDFGNTWNALNLPKGFNLEAITLEKQMIGAVVKDNTLKLLTVEEELDFDITSNTLIERKHNNFPEEIKQSKKRFFKSHENGDFTLIFNKPSVRENGLSSGISVYSSLNNGDSWIKEFEVEEENLMHIKDVKKDEYGMYIVAPHELISYTKEVVVNESKASIDNSIDYSVITVYPNPTTKSFTVNNLEKDNTVSIFDVYGKQIYSNNSVSTQLEIDLSNQEAGIYFIHILKGQERVVRKVIKK